MVARTELGRARRIVLAGHLDTVPPFGSAPARLEDDTLWGLGAVDMKGGLAVLLDLALRSPAPALDVTYVFYACEEVARRDNGSIALAEVHHPELLAADAAVLGEPTGGVVEAGCQGTMRAVVSVGGRRAHTARPWTGVNAVHRLAPVLAALQRYEPRRVVLDGCEYTEQLQAVGVRRRRGRQRRSRPGRGDRQLPLCPRPWTGRRRADTLRELLGPGALDPGAGDRHGGDRRRRPGARPGSTIPVLAGLVRRHRRHRPRAKVGWTDVATFAEMGVPATNFGPGDPLLAHTADEHVSRRARSVALSRSSCSSPCSGPPRTGPRWPDGGGTSVEAVAGR